MLLFGSFFEGFINYLGDIGHPFVRDLQDLTVVGQKTVGFVLNVADLSVDGGRETTTYHFDYLIGIKFFKGLLELFTVGKEAVTVGLVEVEGVSLNLT